MEWVKLVFFALVIITIFTVFSFLDVTEVFGGFNSLIVTALPQFIGGLTALFEVIYSFRYVMMVISLFFFFFLIAYVKNHIF